MITLRFSHGGKDYAIPDPDNAPPDVFGFRKSNGDVLHLRLLRYSADEAFYEVKFVSKSEGKDRRTFFLASPYSTPETGWTREQRYEKTKQVYDFLTREGIAVWSPIVATHNLELPKNSEFWEKYNDAFQDALFETWVLQIDGWRESVGVAREIERARVAGKMVRYLHPYGDEGKVMFSLVPEGSE